MSEAGKGGLLILNEKDNVGVTPVTLGDVPAGHKIALCEIPQGGAVIKYGQVIGRATKPIRAGEWVHSHNLRSHLDEETSYTYDFSAEVPVGERGSFPGYLRRDGSVGIRNEIYIIPTVGCVNSVCRRLEKMAQKLVNGSLDGIFALTHPFGCSQLGKDSENIRNLLCAIARNPNASYVLFVGLGCENNQLSAIRRALADRENIAFFNCQEVGDELSCGYEILEDFAERAGRLERTACDLSGLRIGLKCGGSDAFSGITANPLVGKVTDRLVAAGGSAVLTEVPEMFGAEQLLMNKCRDRETFEKYRKMIEDFRDFYTAQGFPVYENPSPGNREGGNYHAGGKVAWLCGKGGRQCDKRRAGIRRDDPGARRERAQCAGKRPDRRHGACRSRVSAGAVHNRAGNSVFHLCADHEDLLQPFAAVAKANWIDFDAAEKDENALFNLVLQTAGGNYRCKSEDIREIAFFKTGVTL